jgi:alpha-tubulin suppressor-like RCC1 family protein
MKSSGLWLSAAFALVVQAPHAAADAIKAKKVVTGRHHACALLDDRTVKCWGDNSAGQLGIGDAGWLLGNVGDVAGEMGNALPAVDLGGLTVTDIAAGYDHNCALLEDGSVKCWGDNPHGQLGLGDTMPRGTLSSEMGANLPAVDLGDGRTAIRIAVGNIHSCALLDDGSVKCWGANSGGQLGMGTTFNRGDSSFEMGQNLPAVDLGSGRTAVSIAAGGAHTCALLDDGSARCWGENSSGELGLEDTEHRGDDPVEMGDALPAIDLGTGRTAVHLFAGSDHTCARLDDGSAKCWGGNTSGQLGLADSLSRGVGSGEMGDDLPIVNLAVVLGSIGNMSLGSGHTCAVLAANLKCWGWNDEGQLGLGDTSSRGDDPGEMGINLPLVDLGAERRPVQVAAGWQFTCARLTPGRIKCWGENEHGQLGQGDTSNRGDDPDEMGDALPFIDLGTL